MPSPSQTLQSPPVARPGSVRATLHFTRPMVINPTLDLSGGDRSKIKLEAHEVELADADSATPPPSLATHGFEALPFSAAAPEGFKTNLNYQRDFASLCAAAVQQATRARFVVGIPASVHVRRTAGVKEEATISVVHTDFTPGSTLRRIRQILDGSGYKDPVKRYAAFNTWWLAREGPQDRPLAFCDSTSVAGSDVLIGQAHVSGSDGADLDYGEVAFLRYSPRHRWYFYPKLDTGRLLVFCGFDSDPAHPSMVTHCAFQNPTCPPGAPPRISIESRCFAIW